MPMESTLFLLKSKFATSAVKGRGVVVLKLVEDWGSMKYNETKLQAAK